LLRELRAALCGERVVACLTIGVGPAPLAGQPPPRDQPVEGRVERPLVDVEEPIRALLDELRDPPSVHRPHLQDAENDHLEGALDDLDAARLNVHSSLLSIALRCSLPFDLARERENAAY